jgi:hypothetical protein
MLRVTSVHRELLERGGHDVELTRKIYAGFERLLELLIQDHERRINMLG